VHQVRTDVRTDLLDDGQLPGGRLATGVGLAQQQRGTALAGAQFGLQVRLDRLDRRGVHDLHE
jgi:hypothetical protein